MYNQAQQGIYSLVRWHFGGFAVTFTVAANATDDVGKNLAAEVES